MKSKTPYTQFNSFVRRIAKILKTTEDFVFKIYSNDNPISNDPLFDLNEYRTYQCSVLNECVSEFAKHVFLTDGKFIDWLIEACPEYVKFDWFNSFNTSNKFQPIIFHFPTKLGIDSFLFNCATDPQQNKRFGFISNSDGAMFFYPGSEPTNIIGKHKTKLKIAISSLMYSECFPECVKIGAPESLKHPSNHKYEHQETIGISPKILGSGTHGSPTAHYRSGHFRFLRSDKFKSKRFKSVFVCHTFVNGRAETILSPEEI